ncbi:Crp/Fnr family transcriptional regulator [Bradyrhizobium guangzhouense]|uniref:Crp/Fnr family transcriptional regulator n=1 Tax=Bradyrhizobium guangzhouense TaxID=1325095 RepID=A0AAE6C8J9_9BRAD|nr:Crp/Fnr family transcriptional regulator [Bradyrhizobium guangzhouense]QAU46572.1 Crp/Fnr family transcriptional regulator [Bradyrhizobium guangzhouense]
MSDAPLDSTAKAPFDPRAFLTKPAAGVTLERFQAGWQICAQGEPADTVGYIRKGRVKLTTISNRGKEAIVGIIGPGQFFGETSLSNANVRTATVVALEDCLITTVTNEVMLQTLGSEPEFSKFFLAHLLSRNTRLEEDLGDQLLNLSEKRLARLLLVLADPAQNGGKPNEVNLSQEALAEMVGTTRSRISTFMNKFREQGYISYDSHGRSIQVYAALLMSVLGS